MELSNVILVLAQVSGLLFVIASMLAVGLALTVIGTKPSDRAEDTTGD